MNEASLRNEVCLVTGATRGIGRAIAIELGGRGATVIGTATTDGGAEKIGDALSEHAIVGAGLKLDVTDAEQLEDAAKHITERYGSPTVLVNNAGITRDNLLLRMKESEWDVIMDTNLKAVYRLCKLYLRAMTKARHGRIINITSVVGVTGNPGQANYAAAKAGLIGFTKSLAAEVASREITVNAVAPGFIDTDMTRTLGAQQTDALLARIPLGRLGAARDVAWAVAFLASAEAAYITGTTLHVNGGMYMG